MFANFSHVFVFYNYFSSVLTIVHVCCFPIVSFLIRLFYQLQSIRPVAGPLSVRRAMSSTTKLGFDKNLSINVEQRLLMYTCSSLKISLICEKFRCDWDMPFFFKGNASEPSHGICVIALCKFHTTGKLSIHCPSLLSAVHLGAFRGDMVLYTL